MMITLQNTTQIKKCKMFIVSDDMIPYILSNKTFNPIILFFSSKNVIMLKNDVKNVIDATLASDNPSCFRKK